MESTLAALHPGQTGIVCPPRSSSAIDRTPLAVRLRDLGFTEGTPVTCFLAAPLGDPAAYRIRGTTIALRHADASFVEVEIVPQTEANADLLPASEAES